MVALTLPEAQLFRLLVDFFGHENVVPHMSALAVCGGELPEAAVLADSTLMGWAKRSKCLFAIVDQQDAPCMVVEFFGGFEHSIDIQEEEHQRILAPLLRVCGIRYVTISPAEIAEIVDPNSSLDLFTLLQAKVDQVMDS